MQVISAMLTPDGVPDAIPKASPNVVRTRGRHGASGRLTNAVLSHLPLGVAVVDPDVRLVFWNEQAGCLFGVPPIMAAEMPLLDQVLAGVRNLTPKQRDQITAFAATHIAAGDRTEPDSFLRISLGRDQRVVIQMHGIGHHRWMLILDDGKMTLAGDRRTSAAGGGDAFLDPLTGLGNRRHFNQALHELVDNGSADAHHALLMIDLDRFKPINDTLGHAVGDALLCLVAGRLRHETRADDLLVRLGGDEFVILVPNSDRAEPLAKRLVDILSRPFLVEGHVANIGASVGIARFPEHGISADALMRHADLAMYDAKSAGGRTWRLFQPMMAADALARRELETDLRKALAMGELSLAYQAQFNVQTQKLTGFEALLRWDHPTRGRIPPDVFIPVAEELGCIQALANGFCERPARKRRGGRAHCAWR